MKAGITLSATLIGLCVALFAVSAGAQSGGTVERINVFAPSLQGNLRGHTDTPEVSVYLPPGYAQAPNRRYPVLYVLHGYGGNDLNWFGENPTWDGRGAADRAMSSGASEEMIVVMPNCMNEYMGCMYANSAATGNWADFVADDLVAYIDSQYRTIAERESRGLAGHSMGGYGVWLIGMRRPEVFSALYSLSACCLNEYAPQGGERAATLEQVRTDEDLDRGMLRTFAVTSAWSPNPDNPPFFMDLPTRNGEVVPEIAARFAASSPHAMLPGYASALKKMTAIMIDIGEQDGLIGANRALSEMMNRYGVEHTWETYEGDHINRIEWRFEERVLPFFSRHLKR